MAKNLYSLSPERLPKKKAQDITAGAASISSTPSRNRRSNTLDMKNQSIDQRTLAEAKRNGMSVGDIQKIVDYSEKKDYVGNNIGKDLSSYKATREKLRKAQNLDMGVQEVMSANNTADIDEKNRIMNKYGINEKEFDDYYSTYEDKQRREAAEKLRKENEQFAKDHVVLGSLKSLGTNLLSGFEGIANLTALKNEGWQEALEKKKAEHQRKYNNDEQYRNSVKGELNQIFLEGVKPQDKNTKISTDKDFLMSDATQSLRQGVSSNIDSNIGKAAYDVGMGVADQGLQYLLAALTGGSTAVASGLQAGQVANESAKRSLQNGNSAAQAGTTGLGSAAITYALGKFGADKIIESATKGAAKNWGAGNILKNTALSMLGEGIEEGAENVLANEVDKLAAKRHGGISNQAQMVKDYVEQGYDREEAEKLAQIDRWKEIGQDALIGGAVGGLLSGAQYGSARIGENRSNAVPKIKGEKVNYQKTMDMSVEGADQLESRTHNVPLLEDRGANDGSVVYGQQTQPTSVGMQNRPLLNDNGNNDGSVIRLNDKTTETNPGVMYANEPKYTSLDERALINVRFEELLNSPIISGLNQSQTERYRTLKQMQNQGTATPKQLAYIDNIESNILTQAYIDVQNGYGTRQEIDYDVNAQTPYSENPDNSYNIYTEPTVNNALNEQKSTPKVEPQIKQTNTQTTKKGGKIEQRIRDIAQSGINNGLSVDEAMENAYNTVIKEVLGSPSKTAKFHKVFNKVNNEYINNGAYDSNNTQEVKAENRVKQPKQTNENVKFGTINLNENVEATPNVQNVEQTTNGTKAPDNFLNQNNDSNYDAQVGDGDIRNRGYYDSVDLPKDFKEQLNEKTYRQLTNASTIKKANETLNSTSDLWELKDKYTKLLNEQDASSVVIGYELTKRFIDEGRQDIAVDVLDDLSKSLSRAGQFTQAAYITALRNDPIAVLYAMNKEINKINEVGAKKFKDWQDFKLTDEEVSALNNVAPGDTKAIQDITDSIYSRIAAEHPHTMWEKFYDLTKTFMLFNPRTHIRNIAANAISQPVRSATDRVKAALEIGYQLFDKNYKRTSSLTGGNKITDKIANDVFENAVRSNLELNGGKYEESGLSRVQRESPLWKDNKIIGEQTNKVTQELAKKTTNVLNALDRVTGGYLNEKTGIVDSMKDFSENQVTGSNLENLRRFNYLLLGEIEDTPFVKQNFVNSLSNYLAANNITSIDDVPQEAINLAYDEALKATFKDDNALSNTLSTLKKKMGKVGDVILPFTKTPANLAMRGLEYSPAGFVKTFNDFANTKKANKGTMTNADISRFLGDLSKNITGTGMILLGYSLAKNGIITGGYSEDKNERNWQKLKGYQPNAFHIGNKYYTYDWAQPSSIPLIIGTAIYEGMNKMEKEEASEYEALTQGAKSLGQGLINASDAWFNLSPLQNVANILGGGDNASYGNSSPATNILETVAEYPQTLIPSVLGATARANDTTIRNTYDSTSYANTYVNKMKAKIPGLSKTLPASYDVWGEERKRGTDEDAFVSQFINPGTLGYYNEANRDVDNYIDGLYESIKGNENLKDTQVLPRQASNKVTINGEEKKLNNVEYSLRQKTLGEKQKELVRAFSKVADGLTPEEQAKALDKIYSVANADTNSKLYGIEPDMGKEAKEHFDKGADEYARYLKESALTAREKAKEEAFINKINEEIGTDISASTYKTYKERVPSLTNNDIKAVETLKSKYDLSSQSKKITALANLNATDEEKSRYLRMMLSDSSLDSGYVKRGIETLGEENLYNIYLYKAIATKYDGKDNNSLSKKEIEAFVTDNFDTKEEQDTWRYILSNPKK